MTDTPNSLPSGNAPQAFIDNQNGNTLAQALNDIARYSEATGTPIHHARLATAYISPDGFARLAKAIRGLPTIQLLLGAEPMGEAELWQRRLGESDTRFIARKLRERFKEQERTLRAERNHIPFSKPAANALRQLVEALRQGHMQVRRYEERFLHAKAYILTSHAAPNETTDALASAYAVVGSSNLTKGGLATNLEANLSRNDAATIQQTIQWFDELWAKAAPFDLAAFFEEPFAPKTPFEIFLRVLWELYGDEVMKDSQADKNLPLTSFQQHGVVRALRLIQETGGAIVADEVGLGKTFIAGGVLEHYQNQRQRALLICPAALRDTAWAQFISEYQLYLEVVSFEQLARDEQLQDADTAPNGKGAHLARNIGEYQLIIIDEAHNYRNPSAANRAGALRTLLYGKRKDVLMLTATPVNNSLWDLYHLTQFFIKQDAFLADKGIVSIRARFERAMRTNPNNLSPDVLYPIIDATTVKRTRQFIKKHYPNDQVNIGGQMQTIVFPEPRAISVRYDLDSLNPGLFERIEAYFDPDSENALTFARYKTNAYLTIQEPTDEHHHGATGLLLSGLLKRFESSTSAFRVSIERLIAQHQTFIHALDEGYVVSTAFIAESTSADDETFDALLQTTDERADASLYKREYLRNDTMSDLEKLRDIQAHLTRIAPEQDPKLQALVHELEAILTEAQSEAISPTDEINKRKVIIFSFFADTVRWVHEQLNAIIAKHPTLNIYHNRIDMVVGSGQGEGSSKARAAERFAPNTAGKPGGIDATDILISTDVLAEGVNLQQARHIINYDLPWNPMRLVQRHGRIDRIGSQHSHVFMRTIFPADRLDSLLGLEERIAQKIAMAAASVGVVSPINSAVSAHRDFAETRQEIQKLLDEDATLYKDGGTASSTQSGEEYRHTLRKAMQTMEEQLSTMPWKAGSGLRRGQAQGIFFCAKVGERTYLRFVHADHRWQVEHTPVDEGNTTTPWVEDELGRCLRLIECTEDEPTVMDDAIQDAAYDLWQVAREHIYNHWMYETDPANLQPRVRLLNKRVAAFIRDNMPKDGKQHQIEKALDIVEAPWSRRDEQRLRGWFDAELNGQEKSRHLIKHILASGLEPFIAPKPLPLIEIEDIKLLVWMAISI